MEIKNDTAYQIHFGTNSDSEFYDSSDSEECYKPPPINYDPSRIFKISNTFSQENDKFVSSLDGKSDGFVGTSSGEIIKDISPVFTQDKLKINAKEIAITKRKHFEKPAIFESNSNQDRINHDKKKSINKVLEIESLVCMNHFGISSSVLSQKYTQEGTKTNANFITIHKVPKWTKSVSFMNKTYINAISIDEFHRILKDNQKTIFLAIDSLEFSLPITTESDISHQLTNFPSMNNEVLFRKGLEMFDEKLSSTAKPTTNLEKKKLLSSMGIDAIDIFDQNSSLFNTDANKASEQAFEDSSLLKHQTDNKMCGEVHKKTEKSPKTNQVSKKSKATKNRKSKNLLVSRGIDAIAICDQNSSLYNSDANKVSEQAFEDGSLLEDQTDNKMCEDVHKQTEKSPKTNQVSKKSKATKNRKSKKLLVSRGIDAIAICDQNSSLYNTDGNKASEQAFEDASLFKHQTDNQMCGDHYKQTEKSPKTNQVSKKSKATNNPKSKELLVSRGLDVVAIYDRNSSLYYETIFEFINPEKEISTPIDCNFDVSISITEILNGDQNAAASCLYNEYDLEKETNSQKQSTSRQNPTKLKKPRTVAYFFYYGLLKFISIFILF